jgi:hypothetical protein
LGYRLKIMPITINGSGTVTGISAGGLPDDCIVTADIADNNVTTAKIANIGVTEIKIADGAVSRAKRSEDLTLETAKSATGTSVDFTGIPSWVKRVTVMFNGVSTSGTSGVRIQLGDSGGPETSGYSGGNVRTASSSLSGGTISSGFDTGGFGLSTETQNGQFIISLFESSTNTWACSGSTGMALITNTIAGIKALSTTLTQVRITTVNGTDTFDAGSINIIYE